VAGVEWSRAKLHQLLNDMGIALDDLLE